MVGPVSFKAQMEFIVCRRTGVISQLPARADAVTPRAGRGRNRPLGGKTSVLLCCDLGLEHFPVTLSVLTLWFPISCLCLQGRPLQCPHPRRLPKNRGRHAEERAGHEGELLGGGQSTFSLELRGQPARRKPFHKQAVPAVTVRVYHKVG